MQYREDFRPLQPGEAGYSKTARRYGNDKTGEIISRRKYDRLAHNPAIPTVQTGFRLLRKNEGGYSKTARRYINPDTGEIISRRQFDKLNTPNRRKRAPRNIPTKKERKKLPLTKENAQKRFDSARKNYIIKQNEERKKRNRSQLPPDYIPTTEDFFWNMYDVVQHPEYYDQEEIDDVLAYFWGDEYDEEYEYEYPWGETP